MKKIIISTMLSVIVLQIPLITLSYAETSKAVSNIQNQSPYDILDAAIVKTQNSLIKNKKEYQQNPEKILKLVKSDIMPALAIDVIAQLVVGRDKWNKATKSQQQMFIDNLAKMLVYTYSSSVSLAGQYKINLIPFTNDSWQNEKIIVINGVLSKNGDVNNGSRITFNMLNQNAAWKVYDITVEGVSVLKTYQAQFKDYKSLSDINAELKEKNAKLVLKK